MGFGSCVAACQFDAIHVKHGVAVVNKDNCAPILSATAAPPTGHALTGASPAAIAFARASHPVSDGYNFIESVVCGFCTAVGFLIAITILAGIRERIEYNDVREGTHGQRFPFHLPVLQTESQRIPKGER